MPMELWYTLMWSLQQKYHEAEVFVKSQFISLETKMMDKLHTRILRNGWLFFHYLPLVFTPSKSTTWHEHILDPASVYFFHRFLLAFQKTAVIRRQSVPFPTTHSFLHLGFLHWMLISLHFNKKQLPPLSSRPTLFPTSLQVSPLVQVVWNRPPTLVNLWTPIVSPAPPISGRHPKILGSSAEDPGPTVNKAPCTPLVKIRVFKPRPLQVVKNRGCF